MNKQTLFGFAIFGLEGDLKFHQIMSNLNAKNLHFYHGKREATAKKLVDFSMKNIINEEIKK